MRILSVAPKGLFLCVISSSSTIWEILSASPEDEKKRESVALDWISCIGTFAVAVSWELILHLYMVIHTKPFRFAPPRGSLDMETNPFGALLAALEDSNPSYLTRYLAYLDLNMACRSDTHHWRRDALFEETGETYKRVINICLSPLELLASKIAEGFVASASHQPPNVNHQVSEMLEIFSDFQVYAWCAQAVASLEVRSHKEDKFGVAQLSGSHATVLSSLLACLLAVETLLGKKIKLHSSNRVLSHAGIKWISNITARQEVATKMSLKPGSPLLSKSYALADVLKLAIYSIVSEFLEEMLTSEEQGLLVNEWVRSSKPLYGSVELLVQKLPSFLNFEA